LGYNYLVKKIVEKIVAGGVLIHSGKVLIVQRAADEKYFAGYWEVPSGKKELHETVKVAAKREFREETGIDVEVVKPIDVFNYDWEDEKEIREATQIVFLVKPTGEVNVKLSSEHQNFAWISESEIDKYNFSEETKEIIRKALKS